MAQKTCKHVNDENCKKNLKWDMIVIACVRIDLYFLLRAFKSYLEMSFSNYKKKHGLRCFKIMIMNT